MCTYLLYSTLSRGGGYMPNNTPPTRVVPWCPVLGMSLGWTKPTRGQTPKKAFKTTGLDKANARVKNGEFFLIDEKHTSLYSTWQKRLLNSVWQGSLVSYNMQSDIPRYPTSEEKGGPHMHTLTTPPPKRGGETHNIYLKGTNLRIGGAIFWQKETCMTQKFLFYTLNQPRRGGKLPRKKKYGQQQTQTFVQLLNISFWYFCIYIGRFCMHIYMSYTHMQGGSFKQRALLVYFTHKRKETNSWPQAFYVTDLLFSMFGVIG